MLAVCSQQQIPEMRKAIPDSSQAAQMYDSWNSSRKLTSQRSKINDGVYFIGHSSMATVSSEHLALLQGKLGHVVTFELYYRLLLDRQLIHSMEYTAATKRNSYTILYNDRQFGFVRSFFKCYSVDGQAQSVALVKKRVVQSVNPPQNDYIHLCRVTKDPGYDVVPIDCISSMCVYMELPEVPFSYVSVPPNMVKRE
jgi:hypothetical protein